MDKITRDTLIVLLTENLSLAETQVFILKELYGITHASSKTLRAFGEQLAEISQIDDSGQRKTALDSLWPILDQTKVQADLSRMISRLETIHEAAGAQLDSHVAKLRSLKLDDDA